eukprot:6121679-Pleurochrysis_carterae.AAC.1
MQSSPTACESQKQLTKTTETSSSNSQCREERTHASPSKARANTQTCPRTKTWHNSRRQRE